MGNKGSKRPAPAAAAPVAAPAPSNDAPSTATPSAAAPPVEALVAIPPFSLEETAALRAHFASFSGGTDHLALQSLKDAMGLATDSRVLLERILAAMDTNRDGLISFHEFAHGVALLGPNVTDDKIAFTFALFAHPSATAIAAAPLLDLLRDVLDRKSVV